MRNIGNEISNYSRDHSLDHKRETREAREQHEEKETAVSPKPEASGVFPCLVDGCVTHTPSSSLITLTDSLILTLLEVEKEIFIVTHSSIHLDRERQPHLQGLITISITGHGSERQLRLVGSLPEFVYPLPGVTNDYCLFGV